MRTWKLESSDTALELGVGDYDLNDPTVGVMIGNSVSVDMQFHDGSRWLRQRMPMRKL